MIKKILVGLVAAICVAVVAVLVLGPYLRGIKLEQPVTAEAGFASYNCGDGNCTALKVVKISGNQQQYVNKLFIPYSRQLSKDEIESRLYALFQQQDVVCLTGYPHRYPNSTLRLFQAGYGGYRFEINSLESRCDF